MDRRNFVKAAAAAPMFVPRSAFGANDQIQFGLIAAGGRGRYVSQVFEKYGAKCVAIAEVNSANMDKAQTMFPNAKPHLEYRELLQQSGIDAVMIGSPDHHHAPMLYAALDAKKDVYLEKPLSYSLSQSLDMIRAVRKTDRVVQIGMQRRSIDKIQNAKKMVDDGMLGQITLVKAQWHWNVGRPLDNSPLPSKIDWERFQGDAPKHAFEPMRVRYWRYFRAYAGGNMTDQGTHLMDVVQWFTNTPPPTAAVGHGYVAKYTGAEHPDVFSAVFEYPKHMVTWTLDYGTSYEDGWSITFLGDKAAMILREEGFKVVPTGPRGAPDMWRPDITPLVEEKAQMTAVETHVQNFFDCVKSRKDPNCPVEVAAAAVAGPHLANIAMEKKTRAMLPQGYADKVKPRA
jgi:predicted dehydrogenase